MSENISVLDIFMQSLKLSPFNKYQVIVPSGYWEHLWLGLRLAIAQETCKFICWEIPGTLKSGSHGPCSFQPMDTLNLCHCHESQRETGFSGGWRSVSDTSLPPFLLPGHLTDSECNQKLTSKKGSLIERKRSSGRLRRKGDEPQASGYHSEGKHSALLLS